MEINWMSLQQGAFRYYPTCILPNLHQIPHADRERDSWRDSGDGSTNKAALTDGVLRAATALLLRLLTSAEGNRKLPLIKSAIQKGRTCLLSRKIETK